MASLIKTRFVSRTFNFITSRIFTRRCLSSKNTYFKKYKHRRNRKLSDLDVEEILYQKAGQGDHGHGTVVMSGDGGANKIAEVTTTTSNSWHYSKERLKSLKTTEKIIAVVAVVFMLLGYFGIKWMVSAVPPSKQTEPQGAETNEPATQVPAS